MIGRPPAAAALLALLAGCIPEEGPMMLPGRDCMECHAPGGEDDARPWTVAGTVAGRREGARVNVRDASGKAFTLRANQAGNFYSAEGVVFPLQVDVDGARMGPLVADGSCNRCHAGGVFGGDVAGGGG